MVDKSADKTRCQVYYTRVCSSNTTFPSSTNNNLEVLRTLRLNTPTQSNRHLHVWPGSQRLLIPELNIVGQLNGSQIIYTADVMIGMCTGPHHHQQGTTVHVQQCFKIMHVITKHTIHSWALDEQLIVVCEWNTH